MEHLMTGTFYDEADANRAIDELITLGYPRDTINVLMSHDTRRKFAAGDAPGESQGAQVAKGAASGGLIGGTLGAIVAAFTVTGAIGATAATGGIAAPFIAGPLAAALAGGGAGAAAGGAIGALAGLGMPKERAHRVEHDISAGGIVVAVEADDADAAQVRRILRDDESDVSATRAL